MKQETVKNSARRFDISAEAKTASGKSYPIRDFVWGKTPADAKQKLIKEYGYEGIKVIKIRSCHELATKESQRLDAQKKNPRAVENPYTDRTIIDWNVKGFMREVKQTTYGLPEDQLSVRQRKIVFYYPVWFENDNGYIKLSPEGKAYLSKQKNPQTATAGNPKDFYTLGNFTDLVNKVRSGRGIYYAEKQSDIDLAKKHDRAFKVAEIDGKITFTSDFDKRQKRMGSFKKRNESPSTDFRKFQKNRIDDLSEMFQGHVSGESRRGLISDLAPKGEFSRLGDLVQMKVKTPKGVMTIDFDKGAYLVMDLRKNLWVGGKAGMITNLSRPKNNNDGLNYVGRLIQIDYVTAKSHIEGGKLTRFYHELGEVNKDYPRLYIDADGFPVIVSGSYDIWSVGIVN